VVSQNCQLEAFQAISRRAEGAVGKSILDVWKIGSSLKFYNMSVGYKDVCLIGPVARRLLWQGCCFNGESYPHTDAGGTIFG
jgi:hypothetical protein